MKITQIQLIGDDNKIKGYLDVEPNTAFPLTFSISEIRDISKRKGTTSKSITLPRNKNNNILLNNYYDVNIVPSGATFDINKVQNVNIIQNGVSILENAVMQLASVNNKTYTVTVKDKTADFFTTINNKYLQDLVGFNWSTHKYTAANVIASFDNTVADGYKYVMPYNPGDVNINDTEFGLTEFTPGIYAKTYMDKIFSNAGYSYYWEDMDSDSIQFSKLIIPYNGEKPSIGLVESSEFTADFNRVGMTPSVTATTQTGNINSSNKQGIKDSFINIISLPNETNDPGNCYNPVTSTYTTPAIGNAESSLDFEYTIEYDIIVNNPGTTAYLKSYNTLNGSNSLFPLTLEPQVWITKGIANIGNTLDKYNLTTGATAVSININQSYPNGNTSIHTGKITRRVNTPGIPPLTNIKFSAYLALSSFSSSSRYFVFKNSLSATQNGNDRLDVKFLFRVKSMSVKVVPKLAGEYAYDVPVNMYKYIPQKIKQSDFLKSLFTMFNLYSEVDRDNPTRINIKSRNKYYDDGKINDWTKKLCKDKEQEIKFLPELSKKKMILTYKEDKDVANEMYKTATSEVYGQQEFIFDNEYVRDIEKQEIIFSPTPMFNTKFGSVNPLWVGGSPKCNIRILIDGGQYPTIAPYRIYDYNFGGASQQSSSVNVYPHISHWNKPIDPTFDINFGVCDYYFRWDNYGSNTNNNLFNLHWRRTLEQINSGKLMTAYFNLNESDIYQMRLSDKIRIDNSWWNINKIQDYDANSTSPTKVELISIDTRLEIPFKVRLVKKLQQWDDVLVIPRTINNGIRNKYLTTNLSEVDVPVTGIYNYIGPDVTNGNVMGNNNWVTGNSIVFGDDNNIDGNGSFVMGSSNSVTIDTGSGTFILGNNIVATQSNTVYVNNLIIATGGTINGVDSTELGGAYVRGWQNERELGNSVNIGKGKGKLLLTNGSSDVIGIGTDFTDTTLDSPLYSNNVTVYEGLTPSFISFDGFTSSINAKILEVYSDNQGVLLGTTWSGETGEYDFYSYWIPQANGTYSYAVGYSSQANGRSSHAEGYSNVANGDYSHAEGNQSRANGNSSHAEGEKNDANGVSSHAEGYSNVANGDYSHAEGWGNDANGLGSHAEGISNEAKGYGSHVGGYLNTAYNHTETVIGHCSLGITGSSQSFVATDTIFRVGIGTAFFNRKDGFRLYKNGAMYLYPTPLSGVTNGANGFFAYNDTDKRLAGHNGVTWSNYAFQSDIVGGGGATPSLQEVTNVGATTSNMVYLTGGIDITHESGIYETRQYTDHSLFEVYSNSSNGGVTVGSQESFISMSPNVFNLQKSTNISLIPFSFNTTVIELISGTGATSCSVDISTGTGTASLKTNLITGTKTFEFPNASGTLALTSDLSSATGSIYTNIVKQTITNGVTSSCPSQDAVFDALALKANANNVVDLSTNQSIGGTKDFVSAIKKTNTASVGTSGGGFFIGSGGNPYDRFDFVSRDDSDADNFGVINIQVNPEEGISISQASISGSQQSIISMNNEDLTLSSVNSGTVSSIKPNALNSGVDISGQSGKVARLKTSLITGTKTFEFPNNSGTIALLSDIVGGMGATGATGSQGIQGATGSQGIQGIQGATGSSYPVLTVVKANATTTTETIVARVAIPASSIVAGRSINISTGLQSAGTATVIWRLRCGNNGTTTDTLLATLATSVAQVANAQGRSDFTIEFPTTTTAIGSGNAVMQNAILGTTTVATATSTFTTTAIVYIDVTVQLSAAQSTVTRATIANWGLSLIGVQINII